MTHWDGLTSANTSGEAQRILILGATNRIQDIDEAILRRMPKKFPVSLPSAPHRRRILKLILRDTRLDSERFDIDYLVRVTAGMSGSDIKEACRDAAMVPVREYIREKRQLLGAGGPSTRSMNGSSGINPKEVRGVRTEDFFSGKASLREWHHDHDHGRAVNNDGEKHMSGGHDREGGKGVGVGDVRSTESEYYTEEEGTSSAESPD